MAHGFGAAPDGPLGVVARRVADAGIAALAFDFRNFGSSAGDTRQVLRIEHQLEDWEAAIRFARAREDVDSSRIGLWGSSLTGGQVLCVASRDSSLAAAVAQVPYVDGLSVARAAGLRHNLRLVLPVIWDGLRRAAGRSPYLIDGLGPPGARALISVKFPDLYAKLVSTVPAWGNRVAAASVLELYRFRPIRSVSEVSCPLLVVLSYRDRVAPPGPAMRATKQLPYVELALLPARHFELYLGSVRDRALKTEVKFLCHHLGVRSRQLRAPQTAGIR